MKRLVFNVKAKIIEWYLRQTERKLHVLHYTSVEGGRWKVWQHSYITQKDLDSGVREPDYISEVIYLKPEEKVHSLLLHADPTTGRIPRWDCINGWTDLPTLYHLRQKPKTET